MSSTMPEAIEEIAGEQKYLLIMVFWNSSYDIFALKNIRSLTNAPILILAEKYNGVEKAGFLEAGADEYIPYPETVQEIAASCKALIRRYTALNQSPDIPMSHVLQGDVFVDKDYRRIYVCGQEINLARREFEVFNLLASHPERVYTYEQLSSQMGETENIALENSIHSCIRRIRRKLENVPECTCYIGNKRGIGYYFRQNICETG